MKVGQPVQMKLKDNRDGKDGRLPPATARILHIQGRGFWREVTLKFMPEWDFLNVHTGSVRILYRDAFEATRV